MFELRELQNFIAVAERLNVSSAAKAVNLSQPALSWFAPRKVANCVS